MVSSNDPAAGDRDTLPLPNTLTSRSASGSGSVSVSVPGSTATVPGLTTRTSSMAANGLGKNRSRDSAPRSRSGSTTTAHAAPKWWKIRPFRGMISDVRRRAPYYWSDWKDALDYRVVPATVYMYFAKCDNVLPFLSFPFLFLYPWPDQ